MQINQPVFIGHGSPMNAIADNKYSKFLNRYGQSINLPKAIIVISAHWLTKGTYITGNAKPEQIYDFWGFPDEVYNVKYSPQGYPEIAKEIENASLGIQIDYERGIDHAGWAVVKHMYPKQNVPLLEMSLDINKTENEHYHLGKELSKYSEKGILFIGSGNIIHNLRDISFDENIEPFDWAVEADSWIRDMLSTKEIDNLINYKQNMPNYHQSIPTNDHYIPLLYILGMIKSNNEIRTIYEEIQNGSISMRSIEIH
jgi:4,5-DOPA dioxygenase extradiol